LIIALRVYYKAKAFRLRNFFALIGCRCCHDMRRDSGWFSRSSKPRNFTRRRS
jgi:hypothetical protein